MADIESIAPAARKRKVSSSQSRITASKPSAAPLTAQPSSPTSESPGSVPTLPHPDDDAAVAPGNGATSMASSLTTRKQNVVAAAPLTQQDPIASASTPIRAVNQNTIHAFETFTTDPTDPTKIIAHIRLPIPHAPGTYYEQTDNISMLDSTAPCSSPPTFYFLPSLTTAKIPQRLRANKSNSFLPGRWTRVPGARELWTRPNPSQSPSTWEFTGVFRRFDTSTHAYMQLHTNVAKLRNIDPNDKDWQYSYNKWIDQMRRRRDAAYVKEVRKDHWSHAERRALYAAINAFVRAKGVQAFGFGEGVAMGSADVRGMAEAVNKVGGRGRAVDAVRGQIASAHARKNKAVWELLGRAAGVREKLERREEVNREEMWPQEAIPKEAWPEDSETTPRNGKVGRGTEGGVDSGLERQSVRLGPDVMPSKTLSTARSSSRLAALLGQALMLEREAPGLAPNKKTFKICYATGNDIPESESWSDSEGSLSNDEFDAENIDIVENTNDDVQSWATYSSYSPTHEDQNSTHDQAAKQEATYVQLATLNSLQNQGRTTLSGSDESDSDSDSDIIPAVAPPKKQKRKIKVDVQEEVGSVGGGDRGGKEIRRLKKRMRR